MATPSTPLPVGYVNANHDALIISVVTVFSVLSFSALMMRMASKRMKRVSLDWDDYLAITAWVVTLAQSIVVAYGTQFAGLGRHALAVGPAKVEAFLKAYFALSFLQTTALATAKLSALYLLHRIFITPSFRVTVKILAVIVAAWWAAFTFSFAFICSPVRYNWQPTIPHSCGDKNAVFLAGPIPWILTDFAILIAPLFVLRTLHMEKGQKWGLVCLFLTGGITCIIAVYRFRTLFFTVVDPTYDSVEVGLWSIIETNATVFCVCIITVRPVLQRLFPSTLLGWGWSGWSKLVSLTPRLRRKSSGDDGKASSGFSQLREGSSGNMRSAGKERWGRMGGWKKNRDGSSRNGRGKGMMLTSLHMGEPFDGGDVV